MDDEGVVVEGDGNAVAYGGNLLCEDHDYIVVVAAAAGVAGYLHVRCTTAAAAVRLAVGVGAVHDHENVAVAAPAGGVDREHVYDNVYADYVAGTCCKQHGKTSTFLINHTARCSNEGMKVIQ